MRAGTLLLTIMTSTNNLAVIVIFTLTITMPTIITIGAIINATITIIIANDHNPHHDNHHRPHQRRDHQHNANITMMADEPRGP